jgi:catechol 2,3-dioxygenase-like lactoylglutathione lyase family enzyme
MRQGLIVTVISVAVCTLLSVPYSHAAGPRQLRPQSNSPSVSPGRPFLDQYCVACHNERLRTGAEIIEGPVQREGGRDRGTAIGTSVYVRDPDRNLLEFIIY